MVDTETQREKWLRLPFIVKFLVWWTLLRFAWWLIIVVAYLVLATNSNSNTAILSILGAILK